MNDNPFKRSSMDAALTVLNAGVRLSIHPRSGGKISEVFAVSLGRNLLAEPSPEAVLALENERQFSVSGWDEAFPTLEPCGTIPTLGYAWRTPADCAVHDHQLTTQWEFADWRLARTIQLEPMGLAVSYVITNKSDTPRPALWAGHVLMTLNEFLQAQLPAGEIFPGPGLHLDSLKEILVQTDQGWVIPHSPDRGRSWKFFLPNRQPVTLCYSDARVVLTSEAPWWGIWLNLGALHTRCIGVEPTTFPTDCLSQVKPPIGPRESVSTSWRLAIHPIKRPLLAADGKAYHVLGVATDITGHKRIEEQLKDSEALYESLVRYLPCRLIRKDRKGRFAYCNAQFLEAIGKSLDGIRGKTDFDMFAKDIAEQCWQDDLKVMESGRFFENVEYYPVLSGADGRKKETYFQVLKTPVWDSRGEIIGVQIIAWDITEREQAKKQLSETNQALQAEIEARKQIELEKEQIYKQLLDISRRAGMAEVATGVLHNVGNVLNSVNVSARLVAEKVQHSKAASVAKVASLLNEHAADLGAFMTQNEKGQKLPGYLTQLAEHIAREQQEVRQELGSLQGNIDHIKEIVAMQQDYARVSGVTEIVPVRELVEDALKMHSGAYLRHAVRVEQDYAEVPSITIDKHKVLQILVNLFQNAKYACDESGRADKQVSLGRRARQ